MTRLIAAQANASLRKPSQLAKRLSKGEDVTGVLPADHAPKRFPDPGTLERVMDWTHDRDRPVEKEAGKSNEVQARHRSG